MQVNICQAILFKVVNAYTFLEMVKQSGQGTVVS